MKPIYFSSDPIADQSTNPDAKLKSLFTTQTKSSSRTRNVEVTPDFQRIANIKVLGVVAVPTQLTAWLNRELKESNLL